MLDNAICKHLLKIMYGGIENPVIPTCQKAEAQELQVQSQLGMVVRSCLMIKVKAGVEPLLSMCGSGPITGTNNEINFSRWRRQHLYWTPPLYKMPWPLLPVIRCNRWSAEKVPGLCCCLYTMARTETRDRAQQRLVLWRELLRRSLQPGEFWKFLWLGVDFVLAVCLFLFF